MDEQAIYLKVSLTNLIEQYGLRTVLNGIQRVCEVRAADHRSSDAAVRRSAPWWASKFENAAKEISNCIQSDAIKAMRHLLRCEPVSAKDAARYKKIRAEIKEELPDLIKRHHARMDKKNKKS